MGTQQARNLAPIETTDWTVERAAHLLERAGFGGTPAEIRRLAAMTPQVAVDFLIRGEAGATGDLPTFEESGFWDADLTGFPTSRPAATEMAERSGTAMGVRVKPGGARHLQPVTNRFFSTGCAPPPWKPAALPSGGLTACCAARTRCRKS